MVRRNSPNPFANLSDTDIRKLAGQLRAALREVRAETANLTHGPMGTADRPVTHRHQHHLSGDQTHNHLHSHSGDALHIGHDHSDLDRASQSAQEAKQRQHGAASAGRIWNRTPPVSPQQRARQDAAWDRLTAGIEQTKGRR